MEPQFSGPLPLALRSPEWVGISSEARWRPVLPDDKLELVHRRSPPPMPGRGDDRLNPSASSAS